VEPLADLSLSQSSESDGTLMPWRAQTGPQLTAIQHDLIDELLYGGAVFGGKSDFLLGDFAQDVYQPYGSHWHGILFRKTYPELEELISRSLEIYPPWFGLDADKAWSKSNNTWTWPNGATLKMRFMESDNDWMRYWGHAYTWIGWDELGLWPNSTPYMRMKARLRSAAAKIPNKRIRSSANPGGPGHHWVRMYFGVDKWPFGGHTFDAPDGSGMRRVFIRSRLQDNKIGMDNDPGYAQRLEGVGSPEFVRALKEGDWNVIAGAFFPEFGLRHILEPFEIPKHWARFRSMDWGSARPFAVNWWAVSDGEIPDVPRGAIINYREWYGMQPGQPNVGLKLTAEEVADGILAREAPGEMIDMSVLDPSAFAVNGGPSIASRMAGRKVFFQQADNKRVAQRGALSGWDLVRHRLKGGDAPMVYFFSTCIETIRTLPALQHDDMRPEDVDTDGEDHAGDSVRYACSARPWVRDAPNNPPAKFPVHQTINEIIAAQRRKRVGDG
jgi:hypothetical protein